MCVRARACLFACVRACVRACVCVQPFCVGTSASIHTRAGARAHTYQSHDAMVVLLDLDALCARPRALDLTSLLHVLELAIWAECSVTRAAGSAVTAGLAQRSRFLDPRRAADDAVGELLHPRFVRARPTHPVFSLGPLHLHRVRQGHLEHVGVLTAVT